MPFFFSAIANHNGTFDNNDNDDEDNYDDNYNDDNYNDDNYNDDDDDDDATSTFSSMRKGPYRPDMKLNGSCSKNDLTIIFDDSA